LKKLIRYFASNHKIAVVFTVLVISLGIAGLLRMKRDIFPDVDFGTVVITTRYPGASPADVELNVTNRIEEELKTVAGLESFTSYSLESFSFITVNIGVDTPDKDEIVTNIREAAGRVSGLPREVIEAPLVRRLESEEFTILVAGVTGDVSYKELRENARIYKKRLENAEGVSKLEDQWYLDPEIRVNVAPEKLSSKQVALEEIVLAIASRNVRSTAGSFDAYANAINIVTQSEYENVDQIGETVIRATLEGPPVKVSDVAEIQRAFEEPRILTRINGLPAISFNIMKKTTADIIRTVDDIYKMTERAAKDLPEQIEIIFTADISEYVRNRFNVVLNNGGIGFILVIIVLTVFLNRIAAFWVAFSIPVVLLGTVFLMNLSGVYLEIVSLTAMIIILGIIVDDGIIVSENIIRLRESGMAPIDASVNGTAQVIKPVFANMMTTVLAFTPLFLMGGITGKFVRSIPIIVIFSLMLSLIEVVVALPAHLVFGTKKVKPEKSASGGWFRAYYHRYRKIITYIIKKRYLFISGFIVLLFLTLFYAFRFMKFELFPGAVADTFYIYIKTPRGSSLDKTSDAAKKIEGFVSALPEEELSSFMTVVGSQGILTERIPGESSRWAFTMVSLTPFTKRERTAEEIVDDLKVKTSKLKDFEEIDYWIESGGPPVGEPVTIRVIGKNDEKRQELVKRIVEFISSMEGVNNIDRNDQDFNDEFLIKMNFEKLSRLGLSAQSAAGTVRTAYQGTIATNVRYDNEDVDIRVILEEEARKDSKVLKNLLTPNKTGRLINLGSVTSFDETLEPSYYYHYDGERTTIITADVSGGITPVEVTGRVMERFALSEEFKDIRLEAGGEAQETTESFNNLYTALAVAVIAIYLLLVLLFNSYTEPFTVIVSIPFGIIAVIITFALHGQSLGFLAIMGLVGLSGVVVNDSLVMVTHINNLRKEHPNRSCRSLVAAGASDRLRAITMTSLTTVAGLIPLAYGLGGSDPFIAPLALSLGYGILLSTPLTLALIPCLYIVRIDIINLVKRKFKKKKKEGKTEGQGKVQ